MAFNKRTWKGRQGVGLNKFSINGASPVTVVNQPDSITEVGDALSAGNLNDLEDRIADAFDETASKEEVTDLKNALDANTKRIENLEEKAGDYTEVDVSSPWSVPTGKAKNMVLVGVEGVSRVQNMLLDKSTWSASYTQNGVTFTNNGDGSVTVSTDANGATANTVFRLATSGGDSFQMLAGHQYLMAGCPSGGSSSTYMLYDNYFGETDTGNGFIYNKNTTRGMVILIRIISGTVISTPKTFRPVIRDLTQYFNGTIPSDAGTIAEIQQNYPWLLLPSDYGTEMVKTRYEGFRSEPVNLWQETWNLKGLNSATGEEGTGTIYFTSADFIPYNGRELYFYLANEVYGTMKFCFYDKDKNYLGYVSGNVSDFRNNALSNPYPTARFVKFNFDQVYGTTYSTPIQICYNSSPVKTTYHAHAFDPITLSLPTPIELGSAGSVAEKAYLNEDGEAWKTNPLGSVDLGTLTWGMASNWGQQGVTLFYTTLEPTNRAIDNAICAKYLVLPRSIGNNLPNGCMTIGSAYISGSSTTIGIADNSYSDATAFKTAMSGVILYYELATPDADTPLTPLTDNLIATEGGGTLEAVKTYPIDDSFTVGYLTL